MKKTGGYEYLKEIATEETFIEIHREAIKVGGAWHEGIRDEGSIYYMAEMFRKMIERKEDMITMAAKLMTFIIKEHPFWDGNHRTAFETAQLILRAFGYEIKVDRKEAEKFIRSIDKPSIHENLVKEWIKNNMQPIQN